MNSTRTTRVRFTAGLYLPFLLLTACGGSGGGDTNNPPGNSGGGSPATAFQIERVNVGAGGEATHSSNYADTSADGRFVVFESRAPNLVTNDRNGASDIFVRDMDSGAIERVSVASDGTEADGGSYRPRISDDGRFVVFWSDATNLAGTDTNGVSDVFLHDRTTDRTIQLSTGISGAQANLPSLNPAISADGRFVAFSSRATNLVTGDDNGQEDVFVYNIAAGSITRVSVASNGSQGTDRSASPAISADGRFVVFESLASNLVANDTNMAYDIFVHDRNTGTTERVSVTSAGEQTGGGFAGDISADGRFVVFHSVAGDIVANDTNLSEDVFVRDRQAGTTEQVSVSTAGVEGDGPSRWPRISADGRYVVFDSRATNLIDGTRTGTSGNVFVRDRDQGTTTLLSRAADGTEGNNESSWAAISTDGRYAVFTSQATNLVASDGNGWADIFQVSNW